MKYSPRRLAVTSIWRIPINYSSKQRKVFLFAALLLCVLFVGTSNADAASVYVRAGASGANNGSDWTNAYTNLPAQLVRGDTYYIAAGNYGSHTFDDPVAGTTLITVKKATAADHGTDTGWQAAYGTGQAVFNTWTFTGSTGYYDIDGQYQYGILVDFNEGQIGCQISGGNQYVFRYIDFSGISSNAPYNYSATTRALNISTNMTGLTVSHCSLHNGDSIIQWEGNVNQVLIEYCDISHALSTSSNFHSNLCFVGGGKNMIFRYNRFWETNAEGLFFTYWSSGGPQGLIQIYGNLFYNVNTYSGAYPRGIELRQSDPGYPANYGTFLIYNNTFANLNDGGVIDRSDSVGSSSYARNNINYGASFSWGNIPNSNNATVSSSQFVNYAKQDFHLASPTASGYVLPSPYNMDMDGNTRGADGVWDLGAYEYSTTGSSSTIPAPQGLKILATIN